jgi:hypothetical protein
MPGTPSQVVGKPSQLPGRASQVVGSPSQVEGGVIVPKGWNFAVDESGDCAILPLVKLILFNGDA